jgi:hypothetical protein
VGFKDLKRLINERTKRHQEPSTEADPDPEVDLMKLLRTYYIMAYRKDKWFKDHAK